MRLRFFSPDDEAETERYLRTLSRIDAFWQHFERLASLSPERWLAELRHELALIDPDLGLEFRAGADGTKTLYVVSLEGVARSPVALLCAERAKARLPWIVDTERPPLSIAEALRAVKTDFGLDLREARARVGVARGHLLEIVLASHVFVDTRDERGSSAAESLVAQLIGDAAYGDWVGSVSIQPAPRRGPLRVVSPATGSDLPLAIDELSDAIEAALRGILAGLSDVPYHVFCERADWVMFELEEHTQVRDGQRAIVWNGSEAAAPSNESPQSDLFLATTLCPEALKCFLSGMPFSSRRFSRHGERFCYLKLDLPGESDELRLEARRELEEQLNRALVPGRLGCVVGAGLGHEHTYVNLALVQPDASIELLRRRVEPFVPARGAWLLFCDDEWRDEWVCLAQPRRAPLGR